MKMHRWIWMMAMICGSVSIAEAQIADPVAKKHLDAMYSQYKAAPSVQADFDLILDLAESDREIQKGKMVQKGEKYRVDLASYSVYNNGVDMWMYLAEANECQWNNAASANEESELPNLNDLLSMYKTGQFEYRFVDDGTVTGKAMKIEFKPVDTDSEYFKMLLVLDTAKKAPRSIKFFHKDGSRYTIEIKSIQYDMNHDDDYFVFEASDYPGVHVEDLRID